MAAMRAGLLVRPARRLPLVLALALALSARAQDPTPSPAERPPNFVVIMADDLGAGELGCYGHRSHRTPHLDDLARTGVRFETCFTAPICRPTRVMVLTGQYGCHNGVHHFPGRRGGPPVAFEGVDDMRNHVTFAQLLKARGYATGITGKWQLSGAPPTLVTETGFDEYLIWGQYERYHTPEDRERIARAGIRYRARYWRPCLIENGRWRETGPDDYGPDLFTDFAIRFLRRHRDRPFLLYYPMVLTHSPFRPTPLTSKGPQDRRQNDFRRHFAANVEYVDVLVGRIVAALEDLGLREHTILIFTGDNGTGAGHGKNTVTERGARVPLIVNAPGLVRARGASKELADLSDLLPTLCDFAGVPIPNDRPIDGRSLAPFLRGETETTREWIFAFLGDGRILRTKRWLLENNTPHRFGRLYDCGESRDGKGYRDVTDSDDPEVQAVRERFLALLEKLPAPVVRERRRR